MKIIFSSYDSIKNPFYGGGGAHAIHQIAKRLLENYEILVVTSNYPNSQDNIIDGVEYKKIGLSISNPLIAQLVFQFLLPFYTFKLRNSFNLWIESFTPPFSTACLQFFSNRPVIGLVHLLGGKDMSKKYHLPFEIFERLGLRTYKHFIVLNDKVKETILKINPRADIVVIPNGIDSEILKTDIKTEGRKHILFMGRIDIEQKGLDILLESFKQIQNQTNLNLFICGTGDKKSINELKSKIKMFNLGSRVKLVGYVTGQKKIKMFSNALVMVMPSRYETQPLTLLEAFAFGLPIVCFDINDLNWLSDDYVIKVEPFNISLYSESLLKIIKSQKRRDELSENTKHYSKQFDWNIVTKKYIDLIEKVIAKSII